MVWFCEGLALEHIDTLHVSIQSVDITVVGHTADPAIVLNGSLKNLARGNVILTVNSMAWRQVGSVGELFIEESRPVMQATVSVSASQFEVLLTQLRGASPRPATAILALQRPLRASSEGYLLPDGQNNYGILDISWNIPIQ